MARMQGITGGLSGKMGSAVFRQAGGQTIATQYQPVVKNPNTQGQQAQRAKFKLMSQLSAIMAPGFGTLGTIKRAGHGTTTKRNAFTSLNIGLVETIEAVQGTAAKIPMEQLKLTDSFRVLGNISVSSNTLANRAAVVQNVPSDVTNVKFVVVDMTNENTPVLKAVQIVPVANGAATLDVKSIMPNAAATVLAYGLIPSNGNVKTTLDNIAAAEDFESVLVLTKLETEGSVIDTETLGVNFSEIVG